MPKMTCFISHRVREDTPVATSFSYWLKAIAGDLVDVLLCEEISGGDLWRDWIRRNIGNADLLVLLYTKPDVDWSWCLFEAAYFQGSTKGSHRLIGIKAPGISPPATFSDMNFYDGDENGIRSFFDDLFIKGELTHKVPLYPAVIQEKGNALNKAVIGLAAGFSQGLVTTNYFSDRLLFYFEEISASESFDKVVLAQRQIM